MDISAVGSQEPVTIGFKPLEEEVEDLLNDMRGRVKSLSDAYADPCERKSARDSMEKIYNRLQSIMANSVLSRQFTSFTLGAFQELSIACQAVLKTSIDSLPPADVINAFNRSADFFDKELHAYYANPGFLTPLNK